jgi:cell wall-associated NlpC family hydrolase
MRHTRKRASFAPTNITAGLISVLVVLWLTLSASEVSPAQTEADCYSTESLTYDLAQRDKQIALDQREASSGAKGWGLHASVFPTVQVPQGCDPVKWKRLRVVAVAERYIGLPYKHHHIPSWDSGDGPGLDCSNFTAWVYNYGLGIKFTSNIKKQADGSYAPGRRLGPNEPFEPGDLLFIMTKDHSRVSHVVIFVDGGRIIDSHGVGVKIRDFKGWYKSSFSHARRIIE